MERLPRSNKKQSEDASLVGRIKTIAKKLRDLLWGGGRIIFFGQRRLTHQGSDGQERISKLQADRGSNPDGGGITRPSHALPFYMLI